MSLFSLFCFVWGQKLNFVCIFRSYIENPGPMVVFATPGMLHGGLSLEIFKKWCTNEKNMIIMPGYCVAGTVGNKILSGMRKIELKPGQV